VVEEKILPRRVVPPDWHYRTFLLRHASQRLLVLIRNL
jgi:hypothetical protein